MSIKIIACDLQYENNQIVTRFSLSNGFRITTHLKGNHDLTENEIEWILAHSAKTLYKEQDPEKIKLKQEILLDLKRKNIIIEIIRHEQIIGFNVFEILLDKNNHKKIYLHYNLSLLQPDYRGMSFMTPLDFRLAYALAKINKEFIISVFYLSIHINSYRKASLLHVPKYQFDHLIKEIKDVLDMIYHGQYTLVHDDMTFYVTGESMVDEKTRSVSNHDLVQRFFYWYILNLENASSTQSRAAPVLFKIGEDEYQAYLEECRLIGLDLASHLTRLSFLLPAFLMNILFTIPKPATTTSNDSSYFHNSIGLFCLDKTIPAKGQTQALTVTKAKL